MKKILITGGTGLVGRSIKANELCSECSEWLDCIWFYTSSKDYDLRDISAVEELFKTEKFDYIIHLASLVGGLYKNLDTNIEMLRDNMRINMNILEACHKYNVNRGIFCLSSCIYPANPSCFPMTEDMLCESPPHNSNEGYAYSKRMMQVLCKHYNNLGRQYICLSPVNLYGPFDNFTLKDCHVIPGLIHRMYKSIEEKKETFEVYGSGKAMRQFLCASDFGDIIVRCLLNEDIKTGVYNICNECDEYSIKEVVEMIAKKFNFPLEKITYNTSYSDGILKKTVCNNKFHNLYPNYIFTNFEEGLNATVTWFQMNYEYIRK